jgi:molybdopterin converting factor small subunit
MAEMSGPDLRRSEIQSTPGMDGHVLLKVYAALGKATGHTYSIPITFPCNLAHLLDVASKQYGFQGQLLEEDGRLKRSYTVLINGTSMNYLDGLKTDLFDGDEIAILAFVTGG